ncbi:MAG: thioredoxin family protein [Lutibacter sp.]
MKKIAITFLLTVSIILPVKSQIGWLNNFDGALKMSQALNKPVLIDFMASWCGPCKMMDRDVWSKQDIQELQKNYVIVKLDIDQNPAVASRYQVNVIPQVMILDSFGNKLYGTIGYKRKYEIGKLLKEYAINLSGINRAMFILQKSKNNVYSNLRVGQKFQDAILVLNGNVRRSFLSESNRYFKIADKLKIDKSEVKEKIALLKLLNKAYAHQTKNVLKTLNKKFKTVNDSNKALFYFIEFYSNLDLNHQSEMEQNVNDLKQSENNIGYLKKTDYLLSKTQG